MQNNGSRGKQLKQQPLYGLNNDRHKIWCLAKCLFQTFLEGSANNCQRYPQEGRMFQPAKCWKCLVTDSTYMKKGSVKRSNSNAVLNRAKGWCEITVLLRLVLCHRTLGPYLVYNWNPFFYLLAFSVPHFLHWVELYLLLFTYTVFVVFITSILFHLASVLGSLLGLSPKFQFFLTSLFFVNRGGLNIFSPLFLYILWSKTYIFSRGLCPTTSSKTFIHNLIIFT